MYIVAILVKPSEVAMSASIPPCSSSLVLVRNTMSLSSRVEMAGDFAVEVISGMPSGIVAPCATARVTLDDIAPSMTAAPSTFSSAFAASTAICGLVAESRWTSRICFPFTPPASLMMSKSELERIQASLTVDA